MRHAFKVITAEAIKQHKFNHHSYSSYFSSILWPFLSIVTIYYSYKPFLEVKSSNPLTQWVSDDKIIIFIMSGYIACILFKSLIQSSWKFSLERTSGTLELIYLSPANLLYVIIGNAISSLLSISWIFLMFCSGIMFLFSDINVYSFGMILISLLILIIPSLCWGIFTNTIFLFSRDVRTLFTLIQAPLDICTGVKVPFSSLPNLVKYIGAIFPLTWSINIMRKIYMEGDNFKDISTDLVILSIVCVLFLLISFYLIKKSDVRSRKTGSFTLF